MTTPATDVAVSFSMTPDGGAIAVAYEVENRRAESIWLLDVGLERRDNRWVAAPDRAAVSRDSASDHRVRFLLGFLATASQEPWVEQGVDREMAPGARELAAGARQRGGFRVALPLAPWHPYLKMAPLDSPEEAVLAVGFLAGEPRWSTAGDLPPGVDVPALSDVKRRQQWAISSPRPLP
jgi:hypothetical protein